MITPMISFCLCSGLLLGIYHLLLKHTTLYTFNRYYLLFSLMFSLAVPFISIKTNAQVIGLVKPVEENIVFVPLNEPHIKATQKDVRAVESKPEMPVHKAAGYLPVLLIGLYVIVAMLLLIRFMRNLYLVNRAIQQGDKLPYDGAILVLNNDTTTAHSFLRFIFLNRSDYLHNNTDAAILKHELCHARQLHSADIIFAELVKVVCWFNPFILLYRKAIELNHEFIADAAALENTTDIATYQYLLLHTACPPKSFNITSQFNYLTIKKRLIMMNRSTTAAKALLAKAATLPVFIAAFLLFCTRSEAFTLPAALKFKPVKEIAKEIKQKDSVSKRKLPPWAHNYPYTQAGVSADELKQYQELVDKYKKSKGKGSWVFYPVSDADKAKMVSIYKRMSREQQADQFLGFSYGSPAPASRQPSQEEMDTWKDPKYCGLWIDGKHVANNALENYKPADFSLYYVSRLLKGNINRNKYKYQVDVYTAAYYAGMVKRQKEQMYNSYAWFRQQKPAKG